jgi:hypothetical protein
VNEDQRPIPRAERSGGPEIALGADEVRETLCLAQDTYERNKQNPKAGYPNGLETHQTGKLGEVAAESWLLAEGLKPEPLFRDLGFEGDCDLRVASWRIEVKTWSIEHWEALGRCVTPRQAGWYARTDALILWTTVDQSNLQTNARIQGWNTPADVQCNEPSETGWRKILNRQVPLANVRTPDTLLSILRGAQ